MTNPVTRVSTVITFAVFSSGNTVVTTMVTAICVTNLLLCSSAPLLPAGNLAPKNRKGAKIIANIVFPTIIKEQLETKSDK